MNRPEYIDIHAHVNDDAYDNDRAEVLSRAREANIGMINVGTDHETSKQVVELAEKELGNVYAIIGLHPIHTSALSYEGVSRDAEDFDVEKYRKLLESKRVVGIGECGLDFSRLPTNEGERREVIERQEKAFRAQIELAVEYDKPIMIHARDSYGEILRIIDEYLSTSSGKLRGNVHFFAGTVEEGRAFLERGFTLSFTGVITFAKQYKELVSMTPLDRIMSETDCPYVTPVPFRGTRNEPLYVREVAAKIADIKNLDLNEVKKTLVDNAYSVFRLG